MRTYRVQCIDKMTAPELEAFLKDVANDPQYNSMVPVKTFRGGSMLILEGTWDDGSPTSPQQPGS